MTDNQFKLYINEKLTIIRDALISNEDEALRVALYNLGVLMTVIDLNAENDCEAGCA